ncbi:MAG TPA: LysR family transcriptional regulator [Polyangiaceae bacterium]|nr:LysR family transcriptional regulator [Polyangiaceae bacterium]
MESTEQLRVFLEVARQSSFSRAADNLALPKATVSTAVAELEARLGVRLFVRTTRQVRLSPDGAGLLERAERLLADVDELFGSFRTLPSSVGGRLRVDLPIGIARDLIVPHLPEFLATHPGLELELSSTDQRVDLVREGFDCVLRMGSVVGASLVFRSLGEYEMINVVSVEYARRNGIPRRISQLSEHRLIDYAAHFGQRPGGFEYERRGRVIEVPMPIALTVNAVDTYLGAALAGLGIVQIPEIAARGHLARGALVEVLPGCRPPSLPVSLVFPERRHLPERVRVFMDFVEALLRPRLTRPTRSGRAVAASARGARSPRRRKR